MSGFDVPAPPLHPLSTSTTETIQATNHVLPDFIEVLKEKDEQNIIIR